MNILLHFLPCFFVPIMQWVLSYCSSWKVIIFFFWPTLIIFFCALVIFFNFTLKFVTFHLFVWLGNSGAFSICVFTAFINFWKFSSVLSSGIFFSFVLHLLSSWDNYTYVRYFHLPSPFFLFLKFCASFWIFFSVSSFSSLTFYLSVSMGFPGVSDDKESACNAGDPGLIPGSVRSPGEGNGNPLQYFCLENFMDRGACWAKVLGVAKSWTRLSD